MSETVERHILITDAVEVKVELNDDGEVWIGIGSAAVEAKVFAEIVDFIEQHGDVNLRSLAGRDD